MSRRLPLLGFAIAWACLLAPLIVPATAAAEGSPAINLSVGAPTSILYGANATVTLTAENPAKQPYGYNLSYRVVLPEGISYVAGSGHSAAGALEPQTIAGEPEPGKTTLIFANVSDLSPASSNAFSFQVKHSTLHYTVGNNYTVEAGAYIAEAARYLPKFSSTTGAPEGPSSTSFTGFATGSATSTITALEIKQAEESPEGEILRGVHDHQVTYKLTVTNTSVGATGKVIVDDWLPADLEYLGCGGAGADHTTDAPTNSPSAEEYPGSGPILVPTLGGCLTPVGVETLSTDPDGGEEDPTAVYTHVSWDLGTLAAGETKTFEFRAAVPLRENTTTWPAPAGEPSIASGEQATNLNNNSGKETTDGESVITFAKASGDYTETVPVSASEHLKRVAKDLTIEKSASSKTLAEGQVTTWTLTLNSSEYRYNTDAIVTDTVPNGLCPLSSTNLSSPPSSECEPDTAPSSPYFSAVEEANGTWKLVWNKESDAALAEVPENGETTITYYTKTRTHYQFGHKASTPILADDTITNTVLAQATTNVVCGKDTDCSGGEKTPIDHERPLSEAVSDGSSASQSSAGPSITKEIAKSGTACLADEYTTSIPIFHPGDLICWRLIATFPTTIETKGLNVTDFLPIADTFDEAFEESGEKGQARGGGDTLPGTTFNHSEASSSVPGGSIAWTLPEEGHVTKEKQRFERVYATSAKLPHEATLGELQGNLMKFANVNTPEASFSYRAEADYALQFPQLSLTKEVVALNGSAFGPASTATVKGGDKAEFALTVSNAGELEAINTEVWDNLPNGLGCGEISAISNGGSCTSGRITWGDTGLGQPAVAVAANGQTVLRFTVTVPTSINPATSLEDHAGVVEYHSSTNTGGEYTYVPAEDIDTTIGLEANVPAANANAKLETEAAILEKTHTSSVIETGNSATQATIGELVTFEVSATLPAGTAFGGEAKITDPGIPTTRLIYEKGSAEALLDGSAAPAEFKVEEVSGSPVLVLPDDYTAPSAAARKITLRFKARVTNVSENNAAGSASEKSILNTGEIAWTNPITGAQTLEAKDAVPLVEPTIKLTQANNAGGKPVHGGQLVEYKLELSNAATASTAFDNKIVDTVPANVKPSNAKGEALKNGEATASGGIWNEGARTITWELAKLEQNTHETFAFFATINEEPVSSTSLTNKATATTTSIEGASASERTAANAPSAPIKGHYESSTEASLEVEGATVTKGTDSPTATIGHRAKYTLTVTLPAHVVAYDETVIDTLPDSLDFVEYVGAECTSGCPPEAAPEVHFYKPAIEAAATKVAWDLGNLSSTSISRTIKIYYRASVRATHRNGGASVEAPAKIENSAILYYNKTEKGAFEEAKIPATGSFDKKSAAVSTKTTVVEPKLTLAKEAAVEAGAYSAGPITVTDGNTVHYKLKIVNTGGVAAYGVEVKDVIPAQLTEVKETTNSADVTQSWSEGKPEIRWKLKGPVAANSTETVELGYEAKLISVKSLEPGEEFTNAASISTPYFGVPEAERNEKLKNFAGEAVSYREYAGPTAAVEAKVALPTLMLEKAALEGAKYQASANAEVNQPFTWRVIVTNTSSVAAENLKVTDKLPANWEYIAGSAEFSGGHKEVPTQSGSLEPGRELTWSTSIELAAETSTTLTYQAKPTLAAESNPGSGAGHPNKNTASATVLDAAGNPEDAEGPFAAGPASAQGVLQVPVLTVTKTPLKASVAAGEEDSYKIVVKNTGAGVAREVLAEDTLPAGMTYKAGSATASPKTGFSEKSASKTQILWSIESIAAGAQVEITVPVGTEASLGSATKLKNTVAVQATAAPTPVEAEGTITLTTSANVSAAKHVVSVGNAIPGKTITYEVAATNNGPSLAHVVKLVDVLPTGLTYLKSSPECKQSAGVVTCEAGTLEPGHSASFQIEAQIAPSVTGTISNTVIAESKTPVSGPKNNEATATITAHPQAELELSKTAIKAEVIDGQEAAFTLTATNEGPSDAAATTVVDKLPSGLSYVSAIGAECTPTGKEEVTCQLGTLLAKAHASFELITKATAPGKLINSATVSSTAEDPEPLNNTATAEVKVAPAANLQIKKTAAPAIVKVGEDTTYTLAVLNNGPDTAKSVVVSDDLPAGERYVSNDAGCKVTGQKVTCELGELANGKEFTIHLVVEIEGSLAKSTVVNNARVSSSTVDLIESNNESNVQVEVEPAADLSIEKTASPTSVNPKDEVTYTLLVANHGPDTAQNTVVTDDLPAGETYVSNDAGCTDVGQEVTCKLGKELLNEGSETIKIIARIEFSLAESTVSNTAEVSSSTFDPEPADNKSEATVEVAPAADLKIVKTVPATVVELPGEATYTLAFSNEGPDTATKAIVTDELPVGEEFASASGAECSHVGRVVTCSLGNMADKATQTIELTVKVGLTLGEREVVNVAHVSSETFDPEPANNTSSAALHTGPAADMEIEKTGPASVVSGTQIVWSLRIQNNGPSTAHEVIVEDPLPSGVTFTGASPSQGEACQENGGTLRCDLGTMVDGAQAEVKVSAAVNLASGILQNTAHVHATEPDPEEANNTSTATTTVTTVPAAPAKSGVDASTGESASTRVTLRKLVREHEVAPGGRLDYRLIVHNAGVNTAEKLRVCDSLPEQTTVLRRGGGHLAGARICFTLATLAPGHSHTFTIVLRADSNAHGRIVNHATVTGSDFDPAHAHASTPVSAAGAVPRRESRVTG